MRRIIRYCLLFFFLLFAGSLTSNLQAQFYSVQTNTLKLATTTFNAVGVNLAVSFSCIVGCPICKIYLVDHGYRNCKEKIHFME